MSEKHSTHPGAVVKTSAGDSVAEFERLVAKQKYKEAVKQAKLMHKAEATPQSHRRLEGTTSSGPSNSSARGWWARPSRFPGTCSSSE